MNSATSARAPTSNQQPDFRANATWRFAAPDATGVSPVPGYLWQSELQPAPGATGVSPVPGYLWQSELQPAPSLASSE